MSATTLTCPNCGCEIELTEALASQLRGQVTATLQAEHEAEVRQAVAAAEQRTRGETTRKLEAVERLLDEQTNKLHETEAREIALARKAMELEHSQQQIAERTRLEVEQSLRRENEGRLQASVAEAEKRVRGEASLELGLLRTRLAEQEEKTRTAQVRELELSARAAELEQKQREMELEVERRVDSEKRRLEEAVRNAAYDEHALKLREKEKQIEDLREALEAAKRKSEQGSQQLQGDVLELDIQAALERTFPHDVVKPVPKGVRGADLIHEIRNAAFKPCGSIVWETKNTKQWQSAWVEKLKEDQRAIGANIAVLVSVTLPDGIGEFRQVDGVWVASPRVWPALAVALREQLIQVAFAHAASEGKNEKMEVLYRYLAGDQFRSRVQGIVEAFTGMQAQLNRERRAMDKLWREREKQIERAIVNTVGMYGEMRGIVGASMAEIPALELDELPAIEDAAAE
jgi:hypothetical protein